MQEDQHEPEEYVDTRRDILDENGEKIGQAGAIIPKRQFKSGNGVYVSLATKEGQKRAAQGRAQALERKRLRREAYEETVSGMLGQVAELQKRIVEISNDPSIEVARSEMEKFRLGLTASEMILNRVLGKPTTHVEANVSHGIAEEMMRVADEWESDLDD